MYRVTDTLSGDPQGQWTAQAFKALARAKGSSNIEDVDLLIDTHFSNPFINPEIAVWQSALETDFWRDINWARDRNPAGMGVTKKGQQGSIFLNGYDAAAGQGTHLGLYHYGVNLPPGFPWLPSADPRWAAAEHEGYAGIAHTIADLTNRWAIDDSYAQKIVDRLNSEPPKELPVATFMNDIPGLPGGPLTMNHPVFVHLIPASRTYQRPGILAARPRRSVQHGNGNPNSNARGEGYYVVDLQAEGRQASYHSATDDTETGIFVPFNEVAWQAADGSGPGNMNGVSNEMIESNAVWGNASRRDAIISNSASLMGGGAARLNIEKPEQHWTFNYNNPPSQRHDCPNKLRNVTIGSRRAWAIYEERWFQAKDAELSRMQGEVPQEPEPTVNYKPSLPIDALVPFVNIDGVLPNTVVDGSNTFLGVNDVVEAIRDTRRLQYADAKNSPSINEDIKQGTRFVVRFIVRAADNRFYYITPWWTRVLADDVKVISDSPIIPAS
jgi:hypothetical protein